MKTYATMILGCKVNDFEATYTKEVMNQSYREVSFKEKADIYIIFTCCVTNMAESKTRKFIHQARRNNPDAFIVAVGCYSQIKGHTDDFKDVDLIIGSKDKGRIKELIDASMKKNIVTSLEDVEFENLMIKDYPSKSRAFLKVQDGCNQYCSYCIIPYARGKERSAKYEDVIKQAKDLALHTKEIVLTGIHTGRYFDGQHNLYDLLKGLIEIDGLETIRLSSIELTEITDDIIELMENSSKIAHHLHIPLQAGSDKILKLMNRPYDLAYFYKRVNEIRHRINDISISTDLIVGFPQEYEEEFEMTLAFLKKINFSFVHVFPYAKKKNTKADIMDGHFSNDIKKERVRKVEALQKQLKEVRNNSLVGQIVEVFIEKNDEIYSSGYSKQYDYIYVLGKHNIGDIIKVLIIATKEDKIIGEVCA